MTGHSHENFDAETLQAFATGLRGHCLTPTDAGYDDARTIWNAMIDRKPALIVRCKGAADVASAVNFAQAHGLPVSVKGGGHNIAGHAVCDDGMVIDLSGMTSVQVDTAHATARVEAGALLSDVDKETLIHGLTLPVGINSTTGIAGLTLGGGFGWTSRKLGLTIDSMTGADVVTADGTYLRASDTENPDLFWALRGGGGNFGIVTAFDFALHRIGTDVLTGLVAHPLENAQEVLRAYCDLAENASDDITCWSVLRKAPPLPFLPEEWHGKEIVMLAFCHCGDPAAGEAIAKRIQDIGSPVGAFVGVQPLLSWQSAFDPLTDHGARNYWKSQDIGPVSEALIDEMVRAVRAMPGPENELFLAHVGGAASRVASDATAFPARDNHFLVNIHGRWRDAQDDEGHVGWVRDCFERLAPHATGMAYVNFMPEDEAARVTTIYGANHERLSRIKTEYDPANFFRMNQNIAPARQQAV